MGGMCRFCEYRRFKWKWSSGETWAVNIKYLLCILILSVYWEYSGESDECGPCSHGLGKLTG